MKIRETGPCDRCGREVGGKTGVPRGLSNAAGNIMCMRCFRLSGIGRVQYCKRCGGPERWAGAEAEHSICPTCDPLKLLPPHPEDDAT